MIRVVCKTIRDGSNPSVHLRPGVMVSTQDFGSWNIGSSPMAAASHSSNRKGQGTSNPLMWVQILHETSGYVAKRLCTGLLTRDTQVRLLSYPSVLLHHYHRKTLTDLSIYLYPSSSPSGLNIYFDWLYVYFTY